MRRRWAASVEEFALCSSVQGLHRRPCKCPPVLRSLPAVGEFLAPLVKEFAVGGSHGFSVPSSYNEACFYSVGKKGVEVTLDCLVSPHYCCNRFSLSLAGSEINIKMLSLIHI